MRTWRDRRLRSDRGAASEQIRVFVVEDNEPIRLAVVNLLNLDPSIDVVGEAATLREARANLASARPNVALLDVRLPDGSGIEFCRELRSADPSIACVMFTSYDNEAARIAADIAGAVSYLVKDTRGVRLTSAIRDAATGRSVHGKRASVALKALKAGPAPDAPLGQFTAREAAVRDLLVVNATDPEIAAALGIDERTVRATISSIISKITTTTGRTRVNSR